MWNPTEATVGAEHATQMLGDVRDLAGQLGPSPERELAPAAAGRKTVHSAGALRKQVERYAEEILTAREWPVILQAWELARTGQARELITLDREWGTRAQTGPFAEASFRVGRRQLGKLRDLRHERVITRYLEAIESGQAQGWHPVVFGVVLAVYHLPLRQGLMQFATQSLAGLVSAAERTGRVAAPDCQNILDHALARLPGKLPALLPPVTASKATSR